MNFFVVFRIKFTSIN